MCSNAFCGLKNCSDRCMWPSARLSLPKINGEVTNMEFSTQNSYFRFLQKSQEFPEALSSLVFSEATLEMMGNSGRGVELFRRLLGADINCPLFEERMKINVK